MENIIRLQEIFYLFKNECMDNLTDDEMLEFMKEQFDTVCFGDPDYLKGTCLAVFAEAIRSGYRDYCKKEGRAEHLMQAVLYCIEEGCRQSAALAGGRKLSAKESYQRGYELVKEKARLCLKQYNEMLSGFCSYGNENYYDTVCKALPGFFRTYDGRFAPQETIITMDYPVLLPLHQLTEIDVIERYISYIQLEQVFLGAFEEEKVCRVLGMFQKNYRRQFYNICSVFLRHLLGTILLRFGKCGKTEDRYTVLREIVQGYSKEELKGILNQAVDALVCKMWEGQQELAEYLKADTEEYSAALVRAAENDCLPAVVVL